MPLYKFSCMAHGEFESLQSVKAPTPRCPKGCSAKMVTKLVTAASVMSVASSEKTKFIDRKTADLARQFGTEDFNNRYDRSRIDMSATDDIQKKRLAGQTYAVPLDPKTGVSQYLGGTAAPEISVHDYAKQTASEGLKATTITHDDKGQTKLPEAA